MTEIVPRSGKLLLRAQRRGERGELASRDYLVPFGLPVRLGREPRQSPSEPGYDPDYGADLVVRGDSLISNHHAILTWDQGRLRVQRFPKAKNPIYLIDPENPDSARPADDFLVGIFERFRIGTTVFMPLPDVSGPVERTMSGEELRGQQFIDPAPRIEALAALPEMIRLSPDDNQLLDELLAVLLRGVPRADVTAVVALDGESVSVRAVRTRDGRPRAFAPSRQLVLRAVRGYENVQHIWTGVGGATPPASVDAPTLSSGTDWALCVRLLGRTDEGLYLTGRMPQDVGAGPGNNPLLAADLKFAKLAGDIYAGLNELRGLQRREGFLSQMLTPVVRHALAGQPFEEVTAPRQLPVTVLFCDLRGSVKAVEQGRDDLLGTWDKVSQALDVMTEGIIGQDGVIGDFQGDAAMGFWGWPLPQDDQIDRAARAALYIRKKFVGFAARRGHPLADFVCGIGLAYGDAIAGRLGTTDQVKIGVFGPTVNRAARLEAATKAMRVPILIDSDVLAHLRQGSPRTWCRTRRVAKVVPQGLSAPVLIGELLPPEMEPGPNLGETNRRMYEAALDRFLSGDWSNFRRMASNFPVDGPLQFLMRYADQMETPTGTPPDGWDGGVPVTK